MMARGKLLGGLVAGWVGLMVGACGGASMQEAQEDVGTSEATIETTHGREVSTVFYSDNTYTVQVGWLLIRCNSTSYMEGVRSAYYKQVSYQC
ncbi:hypothetical protein D7V97_24780 [Corallococcus sp. CA053C]|uniref:hypothetical protein n=1 Tax=Corallococcus sp. CA053C TaxID=2316732 RepID=UPI000EA345FA|nr:hypothetical protein [Corallococcus sp. CA053C]RKH04823.1 hypothetical protein D7V97_24780 [Corallococcus sp. CA053C]